MPAPLVGEVLLVMCELAIDMAPALYIPPLLHNETVTSFKVAFPEFQMPADGLPTTDDEETCRMPAD